MKRIAAFFLAALLGLTICFSAGAASKTPTKPTKPSVSMTSGKNQYVTRGKPIVYKFKFKCGSYSYKKKKNLVRSKLGLKIQEMNAKGATRYQKLFKIKSDCTKKVEIKTDKKWKKIRYYVSYYALFLDSGKWKSSKVQHTTLHIYTVPKNK